jgi:cytoskeletal protein CcmA (bactofilin family)
MTPPGRGSRRGYTLLVTLIFIALIAVISASLFALGDASTRQSTRRRQNAQALHLAMGGLDDAIASFKGTGSYGTYTNRAIGPGTLSVSVVTPSGEPLRREVTSTGTVTELGMTVSRSVRASMDMDPIPPLFFNAIASKRTLYIHGNVTVNSSPTTGEGDIHSNGDIDLDGASLYVGGDATATGTVATTNGTVTGTQQSGVAPLVFPEIGTAFKQQALVNGITNPSGGTLTVSNGSLVQGKINGNLTVGGSSGCQVTGVVWITGSLTINGPITGTGTVICDGPLVLDARFNYPSSSIANLLFICTASGTGAATLSGNRTFKGSIYVPDGKISIGGNPTFMGSILADEIEFGGTPTVTRWTEFDQNPPTYPRMLTLRGWQEL